MNEKEKESRELKRPEAVFVISGPSGVGKDTLADKIIDRGKGVRAVTATTRPPRPGEKDGVDYFFINEEKFRQWLQRGRLLEWNRYGGHLYGTPLFSVNRSAETGKAVLLVIDVNGGLSVKKINSKITLIFILPPSLQALEKRLRGRGDEDEASIRRRLRIAEEEMEVKDKYDYAVINDQIEEATSKIEKIISLNSGV